MKIYEHVFERIISLENLFRAWDTFLHHKRKRPDVQQFGFRLEENIFALHKDLKEKTYRHGPYKPFFIHDPKQRRIHKATVRDRIVHHAIFSILNSLFEPTFIAHSFSCRIGKGTHKGVVALMKILRRVSRNNTRACFALKCDIKKFFDSIDHGILLGMFQKKIKDDDVLWLLTEIIESYPDGVERERESKTHRLKGVPIGNLTSQLFANIYLNEFDQFVKHDLRVKNYVRYTDDFIIVDEHREYLEHLILPISDFLQHSLKLSLHPAKIALRKYTQGIDFLGYTILPHCILVRTKTKRRILRKLKLRVRQHEEGVLPGQSLRQSVASYLGVLSHANSFKVRQELVGNCMVDKNRCCHENRHYAR